MAYQYGSRIIKWDVATQAKLPVFLTYCRTHVYIWFCKSFFSSNLIEKADISGMSWWYLSLLIVVNFIHCKRISKTFSWLSFILFCFNGKTTFMLLSSYHGRMFFKSSNEQFCKYLTNVHKQFALFYICNIFIYVICLKYYNALCIENHIVSW